MRFLILASAMLFVAAPASSQSAVQTLSAETFGADRSEVVLIDVREPSEWAATGLPSGAEPVSISRKDFVEAVLALVEGDTSKPIAVICKSGGRSSRAAERLAAQGFASVINVGDGMMGRDGVGQGWLGAGLPVRPYRPAEQAGD